MGLVYLYSTQQHFLDFVNMGLMMVSEAENSSQEYNNNKILYSFVRRSTYIVSF